MAKSQSRCSHCRREQCICVSNTECVYARRTAEKPPGHSCPGCKPDEWRWPR